MSQTALQSAVLPFDFVCKQLIIILANFHWKLELLSIEMAIIVRSIIRVLYIMRPIINGAEIRVPKTCYLNLHYRVERSRDQSVLPILFKSCKKLLSAIVLATSLAKTVY